MTPPPDSSKKTVSFCNSVITASTAIGLPVALRAPVGQASTQAPHRAHAAPAALPGSAAPVGQTSAHSPQRAQRASWTMISGSGDRDSGLWHQRHRSGHPLRKTVVRIPGPSCSEYRCMFPTIPTTIGIAFLARGREETR